MRKHRLVQIIGIVIIAAALVYLVLGLIGAISLGGSGLGEGWSPGWRGWLTIPILAATFLGFVALLVFGALLYFLAKIDSNLAEAQERFAAQAAAKPTAVIAPVAAAVAVTTPEEKVEAPGIEVAAPVVAAATVAAVVAAEQPEEAGAVEAPVVEGTAPVVAAATVAAVVAAEQPEEAGAVEAAAPDVEIAAPAAAAAVAVIAAEQPEKAAEAVAPAAEIVAPAVEIETPAVAAAAPSAVDDTEALRAQIAALQTQIASLDSAVPPAAPARLPGTDEAARIAAEMAALKPPKA